jgi:hypothetical protein
VLDRNRKVNGVQSPQHDRRLERELPGCLAVPACQRHPLQKSFCHVLLKSGPNLFRLFRSKSAELYLASQTDKEFGDRQVADQKLLDPSTALLALSLLISGT